MKRETVSPTSSKKNRGQGTSLKLVLFLAAISLVLSLGILEFGLRVFGLDGNPPPHRRVQVLYEGNWYDEGTWGIGALKRTVDYKGFRTDEYFPDLTFRFLYFDKPIWAYRSGKINPMAVVHNVNAHGYRGPLVSIDKPSETYRIVVLGDSFTFGEGVPEGEPFAAQLEKKLDRRGQFEVINAGVSGHNTLQEVLDLERRWLAYAPDMVLIVFYLNDAYDEDRFAELIMGGAAGIDIKDRQGIEPPASFLANFIKGRIRRVQNSRQVKRIYQSQFSQRPEITGNNWLMVQQALRQARKMTSDRGIRLGLVIFPELHELDESYPFRQIHRTVNQTVSSYGIAVHDLLDDFLGQNPKKLWVHVTDHHPNAQAHGVAAEALKDFVVEVDPDLPKF